MHLHTSMPSDGPRAAIPMYLSDSSGYLAVNRDVAAAGVNPLDHLRNSGWREGRDPSADFDATRYLLRNPDVAAAGIDPLTHYLAAGKARGGRHTKRSAGTPPAASTGNTTCSTHPDVAAAGIDPLLHYNVVGWQEGRGPNAWFDSAGYLSRYATWRRRHQSATALRGRSAGRKAAIRPPASIHSATWRSLRTSRRRT